MAVSWLSLALIAIAICAAIATVLALRTWRPAEMSARHRNKRLEPGDRLHRQAAHYRASGALPRWDP